MPPKCKFTRSEIIQAAFDIARTEGISSITARALGAKLGSSSKPIFSLFKNMEEVQTEVEKAAKALYAEYVKGGLKENPAFKGVGMQYIRFAMKEPKLFQLLFMSERSPKPTVANVLPVIEENYPEILLSVQNSYDLQQDNAEKLYRHLWIYTHGIAVLCATNMCAFTSEEMSKMLTEVLISVLNEIQGGRAQ